MFPARLQILIKTFALVLAAFVLAGTVQAAQSGHSTSVTGTVSDPSGAVVMNATVELRNPVSAFDRTVTTDSLGNFSIQNVPFNSYHMAVTAKGFAPYSQDVDVRSTVPVTLNITLPVQVSNTTVNVEAAAEDLLENEPTFHSDISRELMDKLPLESQSSSVSSLVTMATPGISSDSNGLIHGLGDHADNSFSVDGQPITDQQSKVFSNQIPMDSIESLEVISGAPPAEFGDRTSVVINVTTRSGQGQTTPKGSVTASYGSFGSSTLGFNLGYGGAKWGNYISANGLNTGRFLDAPEFTVIHAKGNEENLFDRFDFQPANADSLHLNLGFTRSWFQTPNAIDNLHFGVTDPVSGSALPATDQRSQIKTFNVAPSWTHLFSNSTLLTLGAFVRHDQYNYYPSSDLLADFSPLQRESVAQQRKLTNAGVRGSISYVNGMNNLKAGVNYQHTFLNENDGLGIVDPTLNNPCFAANGAPVPWVASPGLNNPVNCPTASSANLALFPTPFVSNPNFLPLLGCVDLSRPVPSASDGCPGMASGFFNFRGHTDVKEFSVFVQDAITKGNWTANLGLRGDFYNGFSSHNEAEPRVGIAYHVKKTGTVFRASFARVLETPFNENLVLSSTGCDFPVIAALVPCIPVAFSPGWRNEFHAGLEQAFGKYLVFSGEFITKYTHHAYDFSVLGNTPITFPIEWQRSKIPGFAGRVSVPDFHGFTAQFVFSSVAARFFTPQIGGLGTVPIAAGTASVPFRIDHDEKFNQTTHLQYQPWKNGPWVGFNWRYDSGQVAGAVPFAVNNTTPVDLTGLSADQQIQAGLFCGNVFPTLTSPLTTCAPSQYGSTRIVLPAPGTQNPDRNPARIASRNLLDLAVGDDNLFHGDKHQWSARLTVVNFTNKVGLYNFLSTFSGTHFVTPRAITGEIGFHF